MIISASYKTDIPTFYGEWFMNRLRAGYCKTLNPYNNTLSRVDLSPEAVDGFVFWTKNVGPFLPRLRTVRSLGYPFVVQHTVNGYPRALETSVTDSRRATEYLHTVAADFGPRTAVWRYDTIILTSLTPPAFHAENFGRLASALRGAVDEVVVSFAHFYAKTQRNLKLASIANGFEVFDPEPEQKQQLLRELVAIAAGNGITLTLCSQPEYMVAGAGEARCIDAPRLADVAGHGVVSRIRGNRKGCGCFESKDIGEYDTCPHGCVYCYAVRSPDLAKSRYRLHDPTAEFLFPPPASAREVVPTASRTQLPLFGGN